MLSCWVAFFSHFYTCYRYKVEFFPSKSFNPSISNYGKKNSWSMRGPPKVSSFLEVAVQYASHDLNLLWLPPGFPAMIPCTPDPIPFLYSWQKQHLISPHWWPSPACKHLIQSACLHSTHLKFSVDFHSGHPSCIHFPVHSFNPLVSTLKAFCISNVKLIFLGGHLWHLGRWQLLQSKARLGSSGCGPIIVVGCGARIFSR